MGTENEASMKWLKAQSGQGARCPEEEWQHECRGRSMYRGGVSARAFTGWASQTMQLLPAGGRRQCWQAEAWGLSGGVGTRR